MKKTIPTLILTPALLIGCGMSDEEKANVAAVTCSVMSETRNMDAAIRVREVNSAREKIGEAPYLDGDEGIKQSFEWGLCEELVLNDPNYDQKARTAAALLAQIERERQEAERKATRERQAREAKERAKREAREAKERAEKRRIQEEKRRAAEAKRREEEEKKAEEQRLRKEREEKLIEETMGKFRCPQNSEEKSVMIRLALDTGNTELYRRIVACK